MFDWQVVMTHPVVLSVGWALIHALWVGAVLAAGLWLTLRVMPDHPGMRYQVCAAALLAIPLMTALALIVHQPWRELADRANDDALVASPVVEPVESEGPAVPPMIPPGEIGPMPMPDMVESMQSPVPQGETLSNEQAPVIGLSAYLPYAAVLYALGLCMMSLRLLAGWCLTLRLRTRGLSPLPADLARLAERARQRSGVKRAVRFAISSRAAVPCVVGVLRPIVLLPAAAATGLTPAQLLSIFAHELAHIRRHDVLINLLQVLIETLLFFHPAVWWVGKHLRAERECRCDDDAVVSVGSPLVYVDALVAVAGLDAGRPNLSLAATDGGLTHRVRRLLVPTNTSQGRSTVWGASLLAVLIVGTVLTVIACGEAARDEGQGGADRPGTADAQSPVDPSLDGGDAPPLGPKQARVLEIDYQKLRAGDMRYNVVIRPGDIISVPSSNAGFVYIMGGSIGRPGAYTIPGEQELTLYRLIASAGGLADRPEPEPGKVWVADLVRQINDTDQDIYRVSLQGIQDGSESDIYLRTNDLINVHQAAMQEVLDFEQPDWVQAQLDQDYPEGVRPVITQDWPKPIPASLLSPITEADLTPTDEPYVMAEGDTVQVTIYELRIPGRDDIQRLQIDEKGDVQLAMIGPVKAAGLTAQQLGIEIARLLDEKGIMRYATVKVQLLESGKNAYSLFASSSQDGTRAGTYTIPKPDFRLIEAVTIGGVPSRTRYLYVIRNGEDGGDSLDIPSGILPTGGVRPGSEKGAAPASSIEVEDGAAEPVSDGQQRLEQLTATFGELGRLLRTEGSLDEIQRSIAELLEGAEPMIQSLRPGSTRATVEGLFKQVDVMKRAIDAGDVEKARTVFDALAAIGESIPDLIQRELTAQDQADRDALGMTPDEHLEKLAETYRLKEGEDLRVIYPPFAEQRGFYADAEYPYAKGSDNIKSMGFWWDGRALDGSYMSYVPETSEEVLTGSVLRLPWYQLEHLDRLDWDPGVSDWVARKGMPIEKALDAFAKVYTEQTGKPLRFEKRAVTRPCVFHDSLKGEKVIYPPVEQGEFRKVMLTIDPLSDEELAKWKKSRPDEATHRFSAKRTGQVIDAPILSPIHIWMDDRTRTTPGVFYIGVKAQQLSHTDRDYRENLQKIVDNMRAQVGGEWRIEDRTFDIWRPVVEGRDG